MCASVTRPWPRTPTCRASFSEPRRTRLDRSARAVRHARRMTPAARTRHWMFEHALPLWAYQGVDREHGGFAERLTTDGRFDPVDLKRLRGQARQIYAFSHAATLGFQPGADLALQGLEFAERHAALSGGGWARALGRDGRVLDAALDLYDQACMLLALAWLARATGETAAIRLAERGFEAVKRSLGRRGARHDRPVPPAPVRSGERRARRTLRRGLDPRPDGGARARAPLRVGLAAGPGRPPAGRRYGRRSGAGVRLRLGAGRQSGDGPGLGRGGRHRGRAGREPPPVAAGRAREGAYGARRAVGQS